jgi:uncharacterized membrane protein YwzB
MKNNYKIKIGVLFFAVLSAGVFYYQGNALAQTATFLPAGSACKASIDCELGLSCSTASKICGQTCSADSDCASNQHCDLSGQPGACIPGAPASGSGSSSGQTGGTTGTNGGSAGTTGAGNQITCPSGLSMVNNVCLPPSQYTTGIAASTSLSGFIISLIKILLAFAGVIAVVMLVIGGYWYMAAGGNEEMAEKGKNTVLNFVMGLVIIILAYTIVTIVAATLTGTDKLLQQ